MKTIFLSVPMKNRSDEDIKFTIEKMKSVLTAMYPNEDLIFVDNFNIKSHNYLGEDFGLVEDHAHNKALLYLGEAIQRMAFCDHFAYIVSDVFWKGNCVVYHGCRIEEDTAHRYNINMIALNDSTGEVYLPDLKQKVEEFAKKMQPTECCGSVSKN